MAQRGRATAGRAKLQQALQCIEVVLRCAPPTRGGCSRWGLEPEHVAWRWRRVVPTLPPATPTTATTTAAASRTITAATTAAGITTATATTTAATAALAAPTPATTITATRQCRECGRVKGHLAGRGVGKGA